MLLLLDVSQILKQVQSLVNYDSPLDGGLSTLFWNI